MTQTAHTPYIIISLDIIYHDDLELFQKEDRPFCENERFLHVK